MEIKHTVFVTMRPDSFEDQQIMEGILLEELSDVGKRKRMKIRITSTTDVMKLLGVFRGNEKIIKYLPEERHDFHKKIAFWPSNWLVTWIDNGIVKNVFGFPDGNPNSDYDNETKIFKSKIKAQEKTINDLCDFIEAKGTRRLLDSEVEHTRNLMKNVRGILPKEEEKTVAEERKEEKK